VDSKYASSWGEYREWCFNVVHGLGWGYGNYQEGLGVDF
jgi:hypothetical protein